MSPKTTITVCLGVALIAGGWFVSKLVEAGKLSFASSDQRKALEATQHDLEARSPARNRLSDREIAEMISRDARQARADALVEHLTRLLAAGRNSAIENEAVVHLSDGQALADFIMAVEMSAVTKTDVHEALHAVRLRYERLEDLRELLAKLSAEASIEIDANYLVQIPPFPILDPDDSLPGASGGEPFGNSALRFLGIEPGENREWGTGVTVAMIDSGVADHPTFREGQIHHGAGGSPPNPPSEPGENPLIDGHGTAVASIIAGNDSRTPGVAPGASLLSFQLIDDEGFGDTFTLSKMISDAIESGAEVINLSVGTSGDSQLVREMITRAAAAQRLVVASSGNDADDRIVFPAAYETVVAVGSIDANGEHLEFSNFGDQLDLTAPGLGVAAAWPNQQMVEFSGTSASAPFVSGAIAAVLSENPSMNALQAWELLRQFTNDSGAPGPDPIFGQGQLDIGRLMERDEAGIFDIAIASHHISDATQRTRVTIQNRGTESLSNIQLEITSGDRQQNFVISHLRPGQVATREAAAAEGGTVRSVATLPSATPDRAPEDNSLQTEISRE